jgi:hypothetical protein
VCSAKPSQGDGVFDEFGQDQDRVDQSQVVAALDAHPDLEQRRVPPGGVAPDPAQARWGVTDGVGEVGAVQDL